MGRSIQIDSGLPTEFWPLFYDAAIHILNRLPTKALDWETPLGHLYKLCGYPEMVPYVGHLRVYGCLAFVYDEKVAGDKLRPTGAVQVLGGSHDNNHSHHFIGADFILAIIDEICSI